LTSSWRTIFFDLGPGLFVPCAVSWDPETGEFVRVGPTELATWEEAEQASRFDGVARYWSVLRRGMFLLEQDGLRWWRRARKAIRQSTRGGGDSHRRD